MKYLIYSASWLVVSIIIGLNKGSEFGIFTAILIGNLWLMVRELKLNSKTE